MNRVIYLVLWGGVSVSILVILIGLGAKALSPAPFPRVPISLSGIPGEVIRLTPAGLLSLGVLLMVLTPIARVFLTILIFAEERDPTYVGITGLVLFNLLLGVALSLVFGVG